MSYSANSIFHKSYNKTITLRDHLSERIIIHRHIYVALITIIKIQQHSHQIPTKRIKSTNHLKNICICWSWKTRKPWATAIQQKRAFHFTAINVYDRMILGKLAINKETRLRDGVTKFGSVNYSYVKKHRCIKRNKWLAGGKRESPRWISMTTSSCPDRQMPERALKPAETRIHRGQSMQMRPIKACTLEIQTVEDE